ncbi:MAG: TIGR03364 family FAD-dependent oxidoreductase [Planctomycetes bacterium]|nr:TIGR03364 family FAD-dependent oxidoreductase [Planctomycetota bacterium]
MQENVAIVGAGIVGLAHAWSAVERGHAVTVFERSGVASGASIRNFGMIWPIGQPDDSRSVAMLSRSRWLEIAAQAGVWVNPYGSLHLAHRPDEWAVLQEFYSYHQTTDLGPHLRLLDHNSAVQRSAGINPSGFLGALESDLELCVNPTEAVRAIPGWLSQRWNVQFEYQTNVVDCGPGRLRTGAGKTYSFDRIVICSGHDFETLYPSLFSKSPLQKCKLQMLRTVSQPASWKLGCHLASGLTLRHYKSFRCCPSLEQLIDRVANETPELDELGIHVMASQDNLGRIVLGDSHEYGADLEPFDSLRIDELIIRELQKIIQLPDWRLESRWHGIYAKSLDAIAAVHSPERGVFVCTGLGGAGMTLSFGLAEKNWKNWSEGKIA